MLVVKLLGKEQASDDAVANLTNPALCEALPAPDLTVGWLLIALLPMLAPAEHDEEEDEAICSE